MKDGWKIRKLGEITSFVGDGDWIESKDQSPEGIRLIQTGNIGEGFYKDKGERAKYISTDTFHRLNCTEIFAGDCLVSRLPDPIGRACVLPELNERTITAVDCSIIRFKPYSLPQFFVLFSQSNRYQSYINTNATGTTRKRISRKRLEQAPIPVPPIQEQEKIVAELDCLTDIIEKKKQQLDNLESLARSIFYDMFGDPITNEKGWPVKTLGEIADTFIGLTYKPENVVDAGGTIVLRSSNIQDSELDFNDIVRVCIPIKEKHYVRSGDILMCSRNGSFRLVGKVARIKQFPEEMSFGAFMTIIRSRHNDFLFAFFKTPAFRSQLTTAKTATINQITTKMLDAISVPLPPLDLQNEFAQKIEAIETQKELVKRSIVETETLFNSRMDYWFN